MIPMIDISEEKRYEKFVERLSIRMRRVRKINFRKTSRKIKIINLFE